MLRFPPRNWQNTEAQQKWVDQILSYWEQSSSKVKTFSCQFERWEYSPTFVSDPKIPFTQAVGEIKYEAPDKAVYRVTELQYYEAPRAQGEQPRYVRRGDAPGEYWLCDGKSIYEFDHRNKQVNFTTLPQHMQGTAIADGPLPFLFGAKAEKIEAALLVQTSHPAQRSADWPVRSGGILLAAKPKTLQDAQNFDMVELIIDQKEFLPQAMQIYMPGGKDRKVFQFKERQVNPRQRFWAGNFIKPEVPRGWKLVRENPVAPRPGSPGPHQRPSRGQKFPNPRPTAALVANFNRIGRCFAAAV